MYGLHLNWIKSENVMCKLYLNLDQEWRQKLYADFYLRLLPSLSWLIQDTLEQPVDVKFLCYILFKASFVTKLLEY